MTAYIIRRVLTGVLVMAIVSVIIFWLSVSLPGDAAQARLGDQASAEDVARLRASLGLDDAMPVQYARWVADVVRGDLGESLSYRTPVSGIVADRLWYTVMLGVSGWIISLVLGISFGVVAALQFRSLTDRLVSMFSVLGHSIPVFWLGLILVDLVALRFDLLPTGGASTPDEGGFWDTLEHLILPAATLGIYSSALMARITRSSMLDILSSDHIRTAKAKGMFRRTIITHHALRNALIPIITVGGLQLGFLLGGTILVEAVFTWPGLGTMLQTAIASRDVPMIAGIAIVTSAMFVGINIFVDLLYVAVDPRVRV
jgi:ABC-type dipeptide/oligopeptide/nickel transport system permease component